MARDLERSSSQYLSKSVAARGLPISFSCILTAETTTDHEAIVTLVTASDDQVNFGYLVLFADGHIDITLRGSTNTDTASVSSATGAIVAGTESRIVAVIDDGDQRIYIDGVVVSATGTLIVPPTAMDTLRVGAPPRVSWSQYADGIISEVGIWNGALTAADAAILEAGYSPRFVRPDILGNYLPLIRGLGDEFDGVDIASFGSTTVVTHPLVIRPSGPIVFVPPFVDPSVALDGAAVTGTVADADLDVNVSLVGTGTTGTKADADLDVDVAIDGSATSGTVADGDVDAALESVSLDGGANTGTVADGLVVVIVFLDGSSNTESQATGDVSVGVDLDGDAATETVGDGDLTSTDVAVIALDGAGVTGTSGAGSDVKVFVFIDGSGVTGTSAADSDLSVDVSLSGAGGVLTYAFGNIDTGSEIDLFAVPGVIVGTTVGGEISVDVELDGASLSGTVADGDITAFQDIDIDGAGVTATLAEGELTRTGGIEYEPGFPMSRRVVTVGGSRRIVDVPMARRVQQ